MTGFLTLSNTSGNPISVQVDVSDNVGVALAHHSIEIPSHQTVPVNLTELDSASAQQGGIRVSYTAGNHTSPVLINGGLQDQSVGYSAVIPFAPAPTKVAAAKSTIAELGLMTGPVDPMLHFPDGITFTPYTVLRNISNAPLTVTPTLWWMTAEGPLSAAMPQLKLAPYESRSLDVAQMLEAQGLKGMTESVNLVFESQGIPGGLLAAGGAVDKSDSYVFGVIPKGVQPSASKSLSYWSTANGDDTMVTIWNPADEPQDFLFQLDYQGGHYDYPIHLAARATKMFNISQIINSQAPDSAGNVIPLYVSEGSAVLMGSKGEVQHVLVAVDSAIYNVQKATCGSYSCETCNGITNFGVIDNPWTVVFDETHQLTFYETYNNGNQYNVNGQSTWSSSAPSIATVNTGLVSGVNVGSATMNVYDGTTEPGYSSSCGYNLPGCPIYTLQPGAGSPGNVQAPHEIYVTQDVTETTQCSLTSIARVITYTIEDSSGNPMTSAVPIHENVPVTTSSCNNQTVQTGTGCVLNNQLEPGSLDEFNDYLWAGCPSSVNVEPCGFTFQNQQWQWCPSGQPASSIGTVGTDNVENWSISVHGNTTSLVGTTFQP